MAYRARAPRSRSPRSSLGWGKPTTWRRGTGGRHMNGGRVRDAHRPEPKCMSSTGELIDIERVTISLEGGRWKSTRLGNSLAAYPTARTVLKQRWTRPHHCGHMWELAVSHLPSRFIDFKGLVRGQFYTSSCSFLCGELYFHALPNTRKVRRNCFPHVSTVM